MDEIRHTPNPGVGHETSDVNVWAIGRFAIALVAICMISLLLLLGLFKYFQSHEETGVANTVEPRKLFPQPQLQQTPVVDLRTIRVEEDKVLNSYGWVDEKKGLVRIPIDQAIDVLAKRGLRSRALAHEQSPAAAGTPTESGQGVKPQPEGEGK